MIKIKIKMIIFLIFDETYLKIKEKDEKFSLYLI